MSRHSTSSRKSSGRNRMPLSMAAASYFCFSRSMRCASVPTDGCSFLSAVMASLVKAHKDMPLTLPSLHFVGRGKLNREQHQRDNARSFHNTLLSALRQQVEHGPDTRKLLDLEQHLRRPLRDG